MVTIKDFAEKNEYPLRALRYFISEKLTEGEHFFIAKKKLVLPESTQQLIHKRFKKRKDFPISYRRLLNEFGINIGDLKVYLKLDQDYIIVGKLYYFSKVAYAKIIEIVNRKYRGIGLPTDFKSPKGVTEIRSFSEMNKREKEHWANSVRLSKEARELIFNKNEE